jgi:hypothetical protein
MSASRPPKRDLASSTLRAASAGFVTSATTNPIPS